MPYATLPAGTLHYRDTGTGRPLVFLHGLLQDGRVWNDVVDRLSGDVRCIVPDLPLGAHRTAMSPAADLSVTGVAGVVAGLIEHLGLRDVTLVGNDTGGAVAQLVVATRPDLLGRLVLTDCEAFGNVPPVIFRPLTVAARLGLLPVVLSALRIRALRALPTGYGWLTGGPLPHSLIDDWIAAYYRDAGVRRDTRRFVASLGDRSLLTRVAGEMAGFPGPSLIVWGADDRLFPPAHADRLGRLLHDARVEMVASSRTWVMVDQPDRTADLIRRFVRE
ncbi:alpha/beta hydrolase [Actinoplanes italicus]|uniref:Pimeloyl-ACP methyl ester carboxylesterase n=1 Tax=Actinoplanes italicus TaxID=113567 RepID=A0A2T0KKR0_9ACTN|nr:alpha/beta hydrolase [Actinoplanes italicus]PRX24231.1 pimeloyl-ACP methyl ester carboxylesterase [Actinoplanes italicus]GIE28043.1 alpha/beta hydrolase [Actinoplanes italicus]